MVKVALFDPAAITTLTGTAATGSLELDIATVAFTGAFPVSVTVPMD